MTVNRAGLKKEGDRGLTIRAIDISLLAYAGNPVHDAQQFVLTADPAVQ